MAGRIAEKGAAWFANLEFSLYPTNRQMRLGELLLCHGSAKHLLFYTTEGYNSDKECETLGHEDMVYIHTWKTQRRVVARKRDHGTFISIPMDYPLNFKVLPDGQVDTLRQITSTCGLPIKVKVAPKAAAFYYQSSQSRIESPLGELDLVHIYDETYVIANYILSGNLRPEFAVIPLHSPIRGVIAYGLENHPDEVWTELMGYFNVFIQSLKLNFDNIFDVTEIYVYNRELNLDENDDYATIAPDLYIQCDMSALPPMSDTPPPRPPRLKRGASNNVKQKSSSSLTKIKGTLQSYASNFKRSISTKEKPKERPLPPPPPFDEYCDDEINVDGDEKMRDDVAQVRSVMDNYEYVTAERWGQRANITPKFKPPEMSTREDSTTGPPKLPLRSISEDSTIGHPKPDIINKIRPHISMKSSTASVGNISRCVVHPFQSNESNTKTEMIHAKLPPIPVCQKEDSVIHKESPASIPTATPKAQIPAPSTKPSIKPKPKVASTRPDDDDNITRSVLDLTKIYDDHKVTTPFRRKSEPQENITQQLQKLTLPQTQRNPQQPNEESKQRQTIKTLQERQIKPQNPHQMMQQYTQPKQRHQNPSQQKAIRAIDDIPSDISGLSVEQVCACLRLLNMGEYSATFADNQIDGTLLTSLDVATMKESFKMPAIQAIKLEKFATSNWRPKIE